MQSGTQTRPAALVRPPPYVLQPLTPLSASANTENEIRPFQLLIMLPRLDAGVWEMGTSMQASRRNHSLLPVAGGMIAVGGDMDGLAEVYDEASRRWYALPGSSHLIGDNWCDDALEAEKFGMEVVVQLPAAALR